MANMVTRCPKCGTSFRITQAQLQTAKGAVRCGSCLQIFKATENLVKTAAGAKAGQPAQKAPADSPIAGRQSQRSATTGSSKDNSSKSSATQTRPTALSQTDPGIRQKAANSTGVKSTATSKGSAKKKTLKQTSPASGNTENADRNSPGKKHQTQRQLTDSTKKELKKAVNTEQTKTSGGLKFDQAAIDQESQNSRLSSSEDDTDFLISDDMDGEHAEPKQSIIQKEGDEAFSDDFLDLNPPDQKQWKIEEKSLFDQAPEDTGPREKDTADESWAVNLLEELEDDTTQMDYFDSKAKAAPGNELFGSFDDIEDEQDELTTDDVDHFSVFDDKDDFYPDEDERDKHEPSLESDRNYDDFLDQFGDEKTIAASPSDRASMISRIEPAPVEMDWGNHQKDRMKQWLWTALSLLAAIAIVFQAGVIQFDKLSRVEPYRSWYGAVCPLLDCSLPELVDLKRIRAYNLVVRSHPQTEGALVVDTILLNTAPFQQPFPTLLLSFSNLNGELHSARKFHPQEYLGGEMAGQTQIPSGKPVHLSMEIVDPGTDAVNYKIEITK